MSSKQKTATFVYTTRAISISCQGKEKLVELIKKYIDQLNPNSSIKDYYFFYDGNKIERSNYEKSIEENEFGKNESFVISVEKNIKIIQCPKCNYGDCVVSLLEYKPIFYNCEHKHFYIDSYDNFFTDQVYYSEKIICADDKENCKKNGKIDPDFKMCLTCSQIDKKTKSYCSNCIKWHREKSHVIIKYEDKNYYCRKHIKKMKKYCFECKKNLCESCVEEHEKEKEKNNGHRIKSIDSLIPLDKEIEQLKNSLIEINKYIEKLQILIDNISYTLKGAMRIYTNYYNISKHIIEKYETFNKGKETFKNFTIFKCLYNLKLSNKQILEDLKSIINGKTDLDKAKDLIYIYSNKKKEYDKSNRTGVDLNKEDDSDWFKEVCEREKEREREREREGERDIRPTYRDQI